MSYKITFPPESPGLMDPTLPPLIKIRQHFSQPSIPAENIPERIHSEFARMKIAQTVMPGQSVAITAGSRGIRHIDLILRSVVHEFQSLGASPFIFPAMGSHGGGTAAGQRQILANYGITEAAMGCAIKATMEVVTVGQTKLGTSVFLDRFASEADHIFVVNRVKPHTKFIGRVESGLMKMCLIGMGKREGAKTYHHAAANHSWDAIAEAVTNVIIDNVSLLGGIAILQNAHEDIAELPGLLPHEFAEREPELLKKAYGYFAQIPFPEVDLLVVDEMGKEYSGTGMDSNVTGRKEGAKIKVHRLYARALSEQTHGNAQGIGLADFTQQSLVDGIDFQATYLNSQTAYRTDTPKIPMTLANDREVLRIATQMAGIAGDMGSFRLVWIKNTLELDEMFVSPAYLGQVRAHSQLEVVQEGFRIIFSPEGAASIAQRP